MGPHGRGRGFDLGYDEDLSKKMSSFLRHREDRRGVPVGGDGFARFSDLEWALRNRASDEIILVVENSTRSNGRQRFECQA